MNEQAEKFVKAEDDLKKFNGRAEPAEVPALVQPNEFITVIERLSRMDNIPVDKIEQLFKMKQSEDDRNAKQTFNAAFTRAQSKIELVVAEQENTQTGSKYADLKAVLLKAKPVYTAEGFSLMYYPLKSSRETHQGVGVDIIHSGGHTEKRDGEFAIQTTGIKGSAMMTQIHGEGSAFSYARRYLTCMIWNIPTGDDDDGNAAGGKVDKYIDEKQHAQIVKTIKSKGVDVTLFLAYMSVKRVEDICVSDFKKAMNSLKKAKGQAEKKEREPGEDG